jgi:hypothetical protein
MKKYKHLMQTSVKKRWLEAGLAGVLFAACAGTGYARAGQTLYWGVFNSTNDVAPWVVEAVNITGATTTALSNSVSYLADAPPANGIANGCMLVKTYLNDSVNYLMSFGKPALAAPGTNLAIYTALEFDAKVATNSAVNDWGTLGWDYAGGIDLYAEIMTTNAANPCFYSAFPSTALYGGYLLFPDTNEWQHIVMPSSTLGGPYWGGVRQVFFEVDDGWFNPPGLAIFEIANVKFTGGTTNPTMSLDPTVPGLQTCYTGAGDPADAEYDREAICTYNNTYTFVDAPGPVTYSVTYSVVPVNTYSFGTIGFDQTGVNPVPDWTDPTFFSIRIVPSSPAGATTIMLLAKEGDPNDNSQMQTSVNWAVASPTVGTWSFTISNNVNIICVAPNGLSTNLPFPLGWQSSDVEGAFPPDQGMYVYVGTQSGAITDEGHQWVIKNFSITNNGVTTLWEDFADEANNGDPGPVPGTQNVPWTAKVSGVQWRDTAWSANASPPNPKGVYLISTNTPYYLDWNTIQGSGMHVMTNTTLAPAGWGTNMFLTTNAYLFATYYRTEVTNLPPNPAMFLRLKK